MVGARWGRQVQRIVEVLFRRKSVHMRKAIQHHISNGAAAAPFFRPCVACDECYKSRV